jgi:DNA-binding transcriptional LysR family regulator
MDQLTTLRAFVTTARLQSFNKAARTLGVSCCAVSRAIADLEARVQTRLLYRTTRTVTLTEDARNYFHSCVRLLDELDEAHRRITHERCTNAGELRVVVHPMLAPEMLSRLIGEYRATAPDVRLVVNVSDCPVNLLDGTFDMGILPPDLVDQASVIRRTLTLSQRVLVASPAYLAASSPLDSIDDLEYHAILMNGDRRDRGDGAFEMFHCGRRLAVRASTVIEGSDLVLRTYALEGMGIASIPEETVAADLAGGQLQRVLSNDGFDYSAVELCLFYPEREFTSARCRSLIELCVRLFGQKLHESDPVMVEAPA